MKLGRLTLSALAATTLVSAPVVAQAATRSSADVEGEQLRGGLGIPIAVIIAILVGIIIFSDNDEEPRSS